MFDRLLKKISEAFEAAEIPYMIIGGQAVLYYGEPRFTRDIDVTVGLGSAEAEPVLAMIAAQGWRVLADNPRQFLAETMVLPVVDPDSEIRIDFIFSQTEYERQALARSIQVPLDDVRLRIVALNDLVVMKILGNRPRDLEDLRKILIKNPHVDRTFVENTLNEIDQVLEANFFQTFREIADTLP
ncbi:MAG: nucleotidyltransferase [Pirellulales bacterium]|nr:nucleotidyltransferase [Pirellulales bacterium]